MLQVPKQNPKQIPTYKDLESDGELEAADEPGLNSRRGRGPDVVQFHGPQFICNLEGLLLTVKHGSALSSQFTGDKNQQWLLQFEPSGTGSVAIASLYDGRYLTPAPLDQTVIAARTPFYWDIVKDESGRHILIDPESDPIQKLTVPTSPGRCTVTSSWADSEDIKLIIVGNTQRKQEALRTGAIGPFAHPGAPVYYTHGSSGYIAVRNHLTIRLYGAVSGSGSNAQWAIQPGNYQYWSRSSDASVHLSTPITQNGEQSAQVYEGRVGKVLHIQNLESQETWRGVRNVPPEDATYTENPTKKAAIGVKNDLAFDIHVSVFSTVQNGNTGQYTISPGRTEFWDRNYNQEMVFVGVGSAPGSPKAYVGRPGFTLHIECW